MIDLPSLTSQVVPDGPGISASPSSITVSSCPFSFRELLSKYVVKFHSMTIKIAIFVAKYLSPHEEACSSMRSEGNISVQTGHCCNGAVVQ